MGRVTESLCDFCYKPSSGWGSEVKVIGSPTYRKLRLHKHEIGDKTECILKARRGYPRGHRDPITPREHQAMSDIDTYGPKGWIWSTHGPLPERRKNPCN